MSTPEAAVTVSHLTKTYRVPSPLPWKPPSAKEALRDVSFSCPERRITCLLGPNGSGKTTIVKILTGLVEADGGEALLRGRPIHGRSQTARSDIALAPSGERSFYWRLTGRQNLDFFASLHGFGSAARRQRVRDALELTGMGEQADKPVRLYSSGMKQKLVLARALLGEPRVLLLDEPTTHLDHGARKSVHALIRNELVAKRAMSVLLCTNDLHEAQELADSLALLHQGVILAEGPLDALRERLGAGVTLRLDFERPPRAGWEVDLGITVRSAAENSLECALESRDPVPDIVRAAVLAGGQVSGCACVEPSLPDVFERMTGGTR